MGAEGGVGGINLDELSPGEGGTTETEEIDLNNLPTGARDGGILARKISKLRRGSRDLRINSFNLLLVSNGMRSWITGITAGREWW
jgi:hypothetical protein